MSAGAGWSRALLFLGAAASLTANVRHSFIPPRPTEETTARGWQIYAQSVDYTPAPDTVVWAALVVLAAWLSLEVITRVSWDHARVWGWLIKFLTAVSVFSVAVIASYLHQRDLLMFMGENEIMILIGPLLPDGMMLLGTAGLILARVRTGQTEDKGPSLAARVAAMRTSAVDTIAAARGQDTPAAVHTDTLPDGRTVDIVDNRIVGLGRTVSMDKDTTAVLSGVLDMSPSRDMDTTEDIGDVVQSVSMDKPIGDKPVSRTRTTSVDKDKLTAALSTGTDNELAVLFGVSYKTVQRHRRDIVEGLIKDTIMNDDQISAETGMRVKSVAGVRRGVRAELGLS